MILSQAVTNASTERDLHHLTKSHEETRADFYRLKDELNKELRERIEDSRLKSYFQMDDRYPRTECKCE